METPQSRPTSGAGATAGSSAPSPSSSSSSSSAPTSASLAVSPDHEVDFLKEKLEHFKLVIHKLQEELQTQKVRKEGAETVSRLLQESKQEVMALRKKVRAYEAVIRNLQSRLGNHGLPSEITLGDGEQYLPGHSKQMLDNLARENKRLRNIIRNDSGDPEELIRLQKQSQDLQEELEELRAAKNSADGLLHASDNDKDVTIATLRHELETARREVRTRDTLCQELAGETQQLQTQLKGVAEQCQDLARKLQEKGAGSANTTSQEVKQEDNKKTSEAQAGLERKLKEVTEMNMRWQTYNKQREQHVQTLSREVAELKERVGAGPSSMARDVQIEMNRVLDEARKDVAKAGAELNKTKRELQNANKDRDALRAEVTRLQQRMGSAAGNDAAETIDALKAQIQICTEDFESERKDREKAQHRLAKQEAELSQLRRENDALKRAQTTPQSGQPGQEQYNDPFYHYQPLPGNYGNDGLAARGQSAAGTANTRRHIDKYNVIDGAQVQSDGEGDVTRSRRDVDNDVVRERFLVEQSSTERDANSDKNTDENFLSLRTSSLSSSGRGLSPTPPTNSQRQSATSSPVNMTSSTDERDDDGRKPGELLKCPKCDKEFTSSEQFDLLEHIEMCCE